MYYTSWGGSYRGAVVWRSLDGGTSPILPFLPTKSYFCRENGPVTGSFSKINLKPLKEDGYAVNCLDVKKDTVFQHGKIKNTF